MIEMKGNVREGANLMPGAGVTKNSRPPVMQFLTKGPIFANFPFLIPNLHFFPFFLSSSSFSNWPYSTPKWVNSSPIGSICRSFMDSFFSCRQNTGHSRKLELLNARIGIFAVSALARILPGLPDFVLALPATWTYFLENLDFTGILHVQEVVIHFIYWFTLCNGSLLLLFL